MVKKAKNNPWAAERYYRTLDDTLKGKTDHQITQWFRYKSDLSKAFSASVIKNSRRPKRFNFQSSSGKELK